MRKLLLFLATQKGYEVLKFLSKHYRENIGAVVSFDEIGVQKNWCDDIASLCQYEGISFFKWRNVKSFLTDFVIDNGFSNIICISWRYMLPIELNQYLQDGIIVFHDSLLPKYRGFAPVVTAMICGEKTIGASAIFATNDVDAGDIICQRYFNITSEDYIEDVINRMSDIYVGMADFVVKGLLNNELPRQHQCEEEATYSLWRDENDYWINWKASAEEISAFIHAVGYPYKGACTLDGDTKIRIKRCSVLGKDLDFPIRTPGKVWAIKENKPIVICGKGLLCVEEAYNENEEKYDFIRLRTRFGGGVLTQLAKTLLLSSFVHRRKSRGNN